MDHHDGPLCAALGHYVSSVTAVYCPHKQAWLAILTIGTDSDDLEIESRRLDFGPFDTPEEVAARLSSELTRQIRVEVRRWLAARAERPDPASGQPGRD